MEVLSANRTIRDVNVYHTTYYPIDLMLYFEKHHIFEIIFDLLVLLDQKRPDDACKFMARNLRKAAEKYRKINIVVKCPPNTDVDKIVKVCGTVNDSPIISMKSPVTKKRIEKLSHQLKQFGLDKANVIFIGSECESSENLLEKHFHLNKRIDLGHCFQDTLSTRSILPIAHHLKNTIKQLSLHPDHQKVKYVERILMIGRPGSGKHRQARLLANNLDLILVSATELVNAARSERNLFRRTLEIGLEKNVHTSELIATIVQKRLLEPDCLQFGWVLVDFPNTAEDVHNLYHLLITPKKIIHVHTNARLCWKRKFNHIVRHSAQLRDDELQQRKLMLQAEFDFYDIHQPAVNSLLEQQNCVVLDVNGNKNMEDVHNDILKKLMKI